MTWGPFEEKVNGAGGISMTRLVAFMFAIVLCFGVVTMALQDHLHDAGWPFAALASVTVMAVPLQALFRTLAEWFKSAPGKALIERLISKVSTAPLSVLPDAAVTTTTTVTGEQG